MNPQILQVLKPQNPNHFQHFFVFIRFLTLRLVNPRTFIGKFALFRFIAIEMCRILRYNIANVRKEV